MDAVTASTIRYIKLGAGGRWEGAALDGGTLEWGVASDPHRAAESGDWDSVHAAYLAQYPSRGVARGMTNEARAFYEGDSSTVWVTFARGRLWWTQAAPQVLWRGGDGLHAATRFRRTLDGWHDQDVTGATLTMDRLSTLLTRLAGYRRTICSLSDEQQRLCLRYINATPDVERTAVGDARAALAQSLSLLIRRLDWGDFEVLVDLALARSGWVRVSALGGSTKDIDLIVEQPLTGERMAVQVKSSATQQVVNDYAARLGQRASGERQMLICHSPQGKVIAPSDATGLGLTLMLDDAVADLVIKAGLIDWVVERAH